MSIKKIFSIYICFFFSISYSQKSGATDTISSYQDQSANSKLKNCEDQKKRNKKRFNKLQVEAKKIDFKKLASKIIGDLDTSDFKGDLILFYYRYSKTECGNFLDDDFFCEDNYTSLHPFYNRRNWQYKDIVLLSKKLTSKIIIPSEKYIGVSNSNNIFTEEYDLEFTNLSDSKIGKIYDQSVEKERKLYYLTENKTVKDLHVQTNYYYNDVINYSFDTLYFEFENLLNYKVKVTQYVNNRPASKIYEYFDREWRLVESK